LQDIVSDILKKHPDAILIYAGHNEFYGGMGIGSVESMSNSRIIKLLHLKLMNLKTYQLIRDIIVGVQNLFTGNNDNSMDTNTATLMERIVANKKIEYKSKILPELKQLSPDNPNIEAFEQMISQANRSK